jgi:uncharacterized UBP type Zn finger protein
MERDIQQLVEMGATRAQARAALKKHKDVMQAAERIFDGAFDHVEDDTDEDEEMMATHSNPSKPSARSKVLVGIQVGIEPLGCVTLTLFV